MNPARNNKTSITEEILEGAKLLRPLKTLAAILFSPKLFFNHFLNQELKDSFLSPISFFLVMYGFYCLVMSWFGYATVAYLDVSDNKFRSFLQWSAILLMPFAYLIYAWMTRLLLRPKNLSLRQGFHVYLYLIGALMPINILLSLIEFNLNEVISYTGLTQARIGILLLLSLIPISLFTGHVFSITHKVCLFKAIILGVWGPFLILMCLSFLLSLLAN